MYAAIRRHKEFSHKNKLIKNIKSGVYKAYPYRIDENGERVWDDENFLYLAEKSGKVPKKSGRISYSKLMKKVSSKKVRHSSKNVLRHMTDVEDFSSNIGDGNSYRKVFDYRYFVFDWFVLLLK